MHNNIPQSHEQISVHICTKTQLGPSLVVTTIGMMGVSGQKATPLHLTFPSPLPILHIDDGAHKVILLVSLLPEYLHCLMGLELCVVDKEKIMVMRKERAMVRRRNIDR